MRDSNKSTIFENYPKNQWIRIRFDFSICLYNNICIERFNFRYMSFKYINARFLKVRLSHKVDHNNC